MRLSYAPFYAGGLLAAGLHHLAGLGAVPALIIGALAALAWLTRRGR